MVHECAYLYPDGRRCRRIPKRGETLCRDHKRARRQPQTEDAAFTRQMEVYADRLMTLPLSRLAAEAQFALAAMQPILSSRFARTYRLLFSRAEIAVAALAEELQARQAAPARPAGISSDGAYPHAQQNQMHLSHPGGSPRA
jgi:hypothetical protein